MSSHSHSDLISIAAKWVKNHLGCGAVVTELCGGRSLYGEIPDVIGWNGHRSFTVECKISRADFLADLKKPFRVKPAHGMGLLRFYLTPKGLLKKEDVAASGWGLLEVGEKRVQSIAPSHVFQRSLKAENMLMYTALQRVQFRITQPLHKMVAWDAQGKTFPLVQPEQDVTEHYEYL